MNLFYGVAGQPEPDLRSFAQRVAAQYGGPVDSSGPAGGAIGHLADADGVVLGRANTADGQIELAFLGCLNLPVPGWTNGSPLDDPNVTAQFLLDRYRTLGEDFTQGLIGQFAIAIADRISDVTILASDPTGIRTIFYAVEEGRLRFATNLAVLATSGAGYPLNRSAEDFFLCYGYVPNCRTVFDQITYLVPGSIAVFRDGQLISRTIPATDPWAAEFGDYQEVFSSEDMALEAMYKALMLATEQQLASDKKAAVLLGGADSALVASLLHRAGKEVETFSFYYEDASFNQPHTDTLARFLGTRHTWVPITKAMLAEGIDNYPWSFNFPTNWPNYVIQTKALSQKIREAGYSYVYSGDGCDGTFLGYPRTHVFATFLDHMAKLPPAVVGGLTGMLNSGMVERRSGRLYTLALNAIRSSGRAMPERGYSNFKVMDENALARLKASDPAAMSRANEAVLRQLAAPLAGSSLDRLAYAGKNALSPNRSKLAGSSDSTGVVINSPYLHTGMKRFATAIPDALLRPEGDEQTYNGKHLLFKASEKHKLLPPEILYQKKISAVDAPVDQWYSGELRENFQQAFAGLPFAGDGKALNQLLDDSAADRFYRKRISSDALTSHAPCLLATYGRFASLAKG